MTTARSPPGSGCAAEVVRGGQVASLAVSTGLGLVGDLAYDSLDESVLPTLGGETVGLD